MWATLQQLLASRHPWSSLFYLIVGVILGALSSSYLSLKAKRPKLIIGGVGCGGNNEGQHWTLNVMNRPSFLGQAFVGETARDVNAWLRLRDRDSSNYLLYWNGQRPEPQTTIEPGQSQTIGIFSWSSGTRGYCILDQSGEPVARFEGRELKFILKLNDRLGRMTEIPFIVKFDDSHLTNMPQLQIITNLAFETRMHLVKMGLRQFRLAMGFRN